MDLKKISAQILLLSFSCHSFAIAETSNLFQPQDVQPVSGQSPEAFQASVQNASDNADLQNFLSQGVRSMEIPEPAADEPEDPSARVDELLGILRADTDLLDDFNSLFGTHIPLAGDFTGPDLQALFDLIGGPAFDQTKFIAALPKAASLYDILKTNSGVKGLFNSLFETTVASTGNLTAADRKAIFDVTGDSFYVEETFVSALPEVRSLHAALHANALRRSAFNRIFATAIGTSGPPDADSRKALFDTTGDEDYDEAKFLPLLPTALSLLLALRANTDQRAAFNLIFSTSLNAADPPDKDDRTFLFDITGATDTHGVSTYDAAKFLSTLIPVKDLLIALRDPANSEMLLDFNALFSPSLSGSGRLTVDQIETLFDIAGTIAYVQEDFLNALGPAESLLATLRDPANSIRRLAFKALFLSTGGSLSIAGIPTADEVKILFGIVGTEDDADTLLIDETYNKEIFLNILAPTHSLLANLRDPSNASNTAAFNTLFFAPGISLSTGGVPTPGERQVLFGITGTPGYIFQDFINVLVPARNLLTALRLTANAAKRTAFIALFSRNIPMTGAIDEDQRKVLFDVAGTPGYDQKKFLDAVIPTNNLFIEFKKAVNAPKLAAFNSLFDAQIAPNAVLIRADLGKLFDIIGGKGYKQASFLAALLPTNLFYEQLKSQTQYYTSFNILFGTSITLGTPLVPADRGKIFDAAMGDYFILHTARQAYLDNILVRAADLLTAIQADPLILYRFNQRFSRSAHLPAAGAPTIIDRNYLINTVITRGYIQEKFLRSVDPVAELVTALRIAANAPKLAAYRALFDTTLPTTGDLSDAQTGVIRGLISGITDGSGAINYLQATFLNSLIPMNNLLKALLANAGQSSAFSALYGVPVSLGPLSAAQKQTLFSVVTTAGYTQVKFLASLNPTGALLAVLQSVTARLDAFNDLYGSTIGASAPNAAQRTILFGVTATAGYNQTALVNAIVPASDVLSGLRADPVKLAAYNFLFGQNIAASGTITPVQRTALLALPAVAGFDAASLLSAVVPARDLVNALRLSANSAKRTAFDGLFNVKLGTSGAPIAANRTLLFSLVADSGYDQAAFLNLVVPANNLVNALTGTKLTAFNARYGINLIAKDPVNDAQKDLLFTVVAAVGYNQKDFLNTL